VELAAKRTITRIETKAFVPVARRRNEGRRVSTQSAKNRDKPVHPFDQEASRCESLQESIAEAVKAKSESGSVPPAASISRTDGG